MTSPILYVQQTYDELKKVVWPTRPNIIKLTVIVMVISILVGVYIGALDYIFVMVTELVLK
jgi:preprotein translocase SecE subunit